MVKLNKIYTKTGDDGTTGLVRGPRRKKHDLRVDAYGTVDETNAMIGRVRLEAHKRPKISAILGRIQNDLFDLGSDLATPGPDEGAEYPALRITSKQAEWLETQIDTYNAQLQPLQSFVLPGGSPLATELHIARTVARRAERLVSATMDVEPDINPHALTYLNRLSDLLFVLARIANNLGDDDVLWTPGQFSGSDGPNK